MKTQNKPQGKIKQTKNTQATSIVDEFRHTRYILLLTCLDCECVGKAMLNGAGRRFHNTMRHNLNEQLQLQLPS